MSDGLVALFPTMIRRWSMIPEAVDRLPWIEELRRLRTTDAGVVRTNQGGWHSSEMVLSRDGVFGSLFDHIAQGTRSLLTAGWS